MLAIKLCLQCDSGWLGGRVGGGEGCQTKVKICTLRAVFLFMISFVWLDIVDVLVVELLPRLRYTLSDAGHLKYFKERTSVHAFYLHATFFLINKFTFFFCDLCFDF